MTDPSEVDDGRDASALAPDLPGRGGRGAGRARLTSPERVVMLTDGVFAIVLTLLVLEIAVPENLSEQSLRHVLEELRPTVLAWVISFLITGMYWVAHRDLFLRVGSGDPRSRLAEPAVPAAGGPHPVRIVPARQVLRRRHRVTAVRVRVDRRHDHAPCPVLLCGPAP